MVLKRSCLRRRAPRVARGEEIGEGLAVERTLPRFPLRWAKLAPRRARRRPPRAARARTAAPCRVCSSARSAGPGTATSSVPPRRDTRASRWAAHGRAGAGEVEAPRGEGQPAVGVGDHPGRLGKRGLAARSMASAGAEGVRAAQEASAEPSPQLTSRMAGRAPATSASAAWQTARGAVPRAPRPPAAVAPAPPGASRRGCANGGPGAARGHPAAAGAVEGSGRAVKETGSGRRSVRRERLSAAADGSRAGWPKSAREQTRPPPRGRARPGSAAPAGGAGRRAEKGGEDVPLSRADSPYHSGAVELHRPAFSRPPRCCSGPATSAAPACSRCAVRAQRNSCSSTGDRLVGC